MSLALGVILKCKIGVQHIKLSESVISAAMGFSDAKDEVANRMTGNLLSLSTLRMNYECS